VAANLLLYYWIAYTVGVLGKLGWPLGCLAALLVSVYMALYISAAGYFLFRLHDRLGPAGLWAFPVVWTGLEYARSVLLTGSPWMLLGYSLAGRTVLVQAADLAGVFGLGFLLSAAGVCVYAALKRIAAGERWAAALPIAAFSAILAFLLLYGSLRVGQVGVNAPDRRLRVGIAQGGIDQSRKWDASYQSATLKTYEALSREAASRGVDVLVWPETAAPFFYGWEADLSRHVERIASENGLPLIFGAPWFSPSEGGKYFNSVFLLDGKGIPESRYDKRHLVPFGEYIPLRSVLFFIRKLTEGGEDFSPGTGPALFPVRGGLAGASICYEAVFPGIIRDSVLGGATFLVNVTNDAWFGDTVAPRQHFAMARMRCVEFRRPMVRAANSGISALVDARGEVVASLGLFRSGVVTGEIFPGKGETVYAKTGEIFAISCTIITFLILCILLRGGNGIRTPGRKIRRA
jgi:apolipoprotein N-acyltransferase